MFSKAVPVSNYDAQTVKQPSTAMEQEDDVMSDDDHVNIVFFVGFSLVTKKKKQSNYCFSFLILDDYC